MKRANRLRQPAATPKPPRPLKGRDCKMWLSSEFVTWCKRHGFKPEGFGRCVLHTFALENPLGAIIRSDEGPVPVEEIYDLPGAGGELEKEK